LRLYVQSETADARPANFDPAIERGVNVLSLVREIDASGLDPAVAAAVRTELRELAAVYEPAVRSFRGAVDRLLSNQAQAVVTLDNDYRSFPRMLEELMHAAEKTPSKLGPNVTPALAQHVARELGRIVHLVWTYCGKDSMGVRPDALEIEKSVMTGLERLAEVCQGKAGTVIENLGTLARASRLARGVGDATETHRVANSSDLDLLRHVLKPTLEGDARFAFSRERWEGDVDMHVKRAGRLFSHVVSHHPRPAEAIGIPLLLELIAAAVDPKTPRRVAEVAHWLTISDAPPAVLGCLELYLADHKNPHAQTIAAQLLGKWLSRVPEVPAKMVTKLFDTAVGTRNPQVFEACLWSITSLANSDKDVAALVVDNASRLTRLRQPSAPLVGALLLRGISGGIAAPALERVLQLPHSMCCHIAALGLLEQGGMGVTTQKSHTELAYDVVDALSSRLGRRTADEIALGLGLEGPLGDTAKAFETRYASFIALGSLRTDDPTLQAKAIGSVARLVPGELNVPATATIMQLAAQGDSQKMFAYGDAAHALATKVTGAPTL
jgi:hypothetical protein